MASLKFKYNDLYKDNEDKKIIESLKKRLNDLIIKDIKNQKKAALIIEEWLKSQKK